MFSLLRGGLRLELQRAGRVPTPDDPGGCVLRGRARDALLGGLWLQASAGAGADEDAAVSLQSWSFTVKGTPQPKGSSRAFVRNGRAIVTSANPAVKTWEETIRFVLQDWPNAVLTGPVSLVMVFTVVRPASVSAKRRPQPTVKPDLSKLYRAAEDAMTGIVFVDDAQVVEALVRKQYGDTPGLKCEILWSDGGPE